MIGHKTLSTTLRLSTLSATLLVGAALLGPAAAQVAPGPEAPRDGASPDDGIATPAGADGLSSLLPLLLTSPDRKRLAEELEAALREGDLQKAEQSLNAAIEVGTLAVVLIDHLRGPDLVAALQGLGIRGPSGPAPETAGSAADPALRTCPSPGTNLAELQQALEQERSSAAIASETLARLTQERDALEERLKKETDVKALRVSEMQHALRREQDQGRAALHELERLQAGYRALQAADQQDKASGVSTLSETQARLRQERDRADQAGQRLVDAQQALRDLQTSGDERLASGAARVAELESALASARERGDLLIRELATVTEQLHALQEPHRASATPVVFRLAATGTQPPLAVPAREEPPAAEPPMPLASDAAPAAPDATSALSSAGSASVVVAALPDRIQPLPLGTAIGSPAGSAPPANPPAAPEPPPGAAAETTGLGERLTARAEELFRNGDVSGARLLLERAMAGGHARAAFLLAETFDPNVLARMGVLGIRGDPARARELYARARALGIVQAGERMEALK